jgi:hypothetical protein
LNRDSDDPVRDAVPVKTVTHRLAVFTGKTPVLNVALAMFRRLRLGVTSRRFRRSASLSVRATVTSRQAEGVTVT